LLGVGVESYLAAASESKRGMTLLIRWALPWDSDLFKVGKLTPEVRGFNPEPWLFKLNNLTLIKSMLLSRRLR
jgi:hypothetical protein